MAKATKRVLGLNLKRFWHYFSAKACSNCPSPAHIELEKRRISKFSLRRSWRWCLSRGAGFVFSWAWRRCAAKLPYWCCHQFSYHLKISHWFVPFLRVFCSNWLCCSQVWWCFGYFCCRGDGRTSGPELCSIKYFFDKFSNFGKKYLAILKNILNLLGYLRRLARWFRNTGAVILHDVWRNLFETNLKLIKFNCKNKIIANLKNQKKIVYNVTRMKMKKCRNTNWTISHAH